MISQENKNEQRWLNKNFDSLSLTFLISALDDGIVLIIQQMTC